MLSKCCTQYVRKFGKPRRGHKIGKGQSSSQFPKRAVLRNVQATRQLHTSPMLVRLCSKFYMLGSVNMLMWTKNFQMSKLGLEKAEEPEIKLPTFVGSMKKQESSRKTSTFALLITPNLWLCGSQQTVENSQTDVNTRPPDLPLEKSVCRSGSNSYNWTWNNRLVPKWERSLSRLYIVILLI